jgi:hypothetical protein
MVYPVSQEEQDRREKVGTKGPREILVIPVELEMMVLMATLDPQDQE